MTAPLVAPEATALLERVLADDAPPFALLYRPGSSGDSGVDVLIGEVAEPARLADIPSGATVAAQTEGTARHDVLVLLPHRQIAERGFAGVDDGTPLLSMTVTEHAQVALSVVLDRLPNEPISVSNEQFVPDDSEYAGIVSKIIADEIGTGEGSNFVIKRSFVADIEDFGPRLALSFFRRTLERETGAYWTFLVHTGDRTFVGATPEQHITLNSGTAVMNPISGTYRYPGSGPVLEEVIDFLADRKETDELYMVVDEELKMMSAICDGGARIRGPFLQEMAHLAHTGYLIEGQTDRDPREILRSTMFAPTVTGSPLESACRVIARYEPRGRGYYGGVLALIGRDEQGRDVLDSALLIRTADIDAGGRVDIGVGATLVRHSDPRSEVAETRAKAAGLLGALTAEPPRSLGEHPQVRAALERRNRTIAGFWLSDRSGQSRPQGDLAGRRVLVVDGEDAFTAMLAYQLSSLGIAVTVERYQESHDFAPFDLVVMGPGPGDPRDGEDPKIASLSAALEALLRLRKPFVAICLSHQLLSCRLGFELQRRPEPNQGVQREIDLFGDRNRVGFYNTFAAVSADDVVQCERIGDVAVSRDARTGEVHALRGPHFASMQFHPESVLTQSGVGIVADVMRGVLDL